MRRTVLKFGGEALADGPAVRRAAAIVAQEHARGSRVVVVVSAHGGVTDQLESIARAAAAGRVETGSVRVRHRSLLAQLDLPSELLDRYWRELATLLDQVRRRGRLEPAELDHALSFGERLSARVCARALRAAGVPATPVDAWDLGLITDSNHGCARPLAGIDAAVRAALEDVPDVPVVTGFLARDAGGRATTLGRGGSDLTASLVAEAIGADELRFWKTVGGILSADPRLVPEARVLGSVTYSEAAELAFHGARVLHPAAVAPVVRARCSVSVSSVRTPDAPGTVFVSELDRAGPVSVASKAEILGIEVPVAAPERRSESAARLFAVLEACGATPGWVAADGERLRAFVDPGPGVPAALAELGDEARLLRGLASVALVGHGAGGTARVGARALEALAGGAAEERIEALQTSGSVRSASYAFVVRASDLQRAVRRLHARIVVAPAPGATPATAEN